MIRIDGEPRTKKNSMRIIRMGKRMAIRPSKAYEVYEAEFIKQVQSLGLDNQMDCRRLNIACIYYMSTKRRVDLTNLLGATMDCLVAAKVIVDDNCHIAFSHDGSRVKYDKKNPRVEIYLTETNEVDELL